MKHPSLSTRSITARVVLGCLALSAAWLTAGCQKSEEPKEAPKTLVSVENLQTAYGVQLKRARMYELFVPQAEKEKYRGVAALYRALNRSESIHAAMHASLLRKHGAEPGQPKFDSTVVGTTMQTLKMALSCEELEHGSMYPNLSRTAALEEFQEGVDQFTMITAVEERHIELLREAQDRMGRIDAKFLVCPGCGYVVTSDQTEECPVCKAAKPKFEKI